MPPRHLAALSLFAIADGEGPAVEEDEAGDFAHTASGGLGPAAGAYQKKLAVTNLPTILVLSPTGKILYDERPADTLAFLRLRAILQASTPTTSAPSP